MWAEVGARLRRLEGTEDNVLAAEDWTELVGG